MMLHENEIEKAVNALSRKDGVIVVPTDTTYGVICRVDCPEAVDRIYNAKGRDRSKPLIILGSDAGLLFQWVTGDITLALVLAARFWPGPLTIIARAAEKVLPGILSDGRTVGLRMPKHTALLDVLSRLPRCSAASTSANLSGAGEPTSLEAVRQSLGDSVDFVMSDCGEPPAGSVSTVVDLTGDEPVVLREGALDKELLFSSINEVVRR